ncbi:MAG: pyruvate formate lyase-activating protein [Victivallales bacterium]|nr:pyruvate formate lyase-activating protein [Victivallales bacterium]
MECSGRVHSYESCGTVDGPGLRFVVFLQGCPLRCQYCHNPDSWSASGGRVVSVGEVVNEIVKYRSYMRFSGGGVTLSGGEPLMQPEFTAALLRECRTRGIHTALDTSGYAALRHSAQVFEYSDLVLLDIKAIRDDVYQTLTGRELHNTLETAAYLASRNIPVWIRHVLVPGLTDDDIMLGELADYCASLGNVSQVEILPFHQIGEYKWQELKLDYKLTGIYPPNSERLANAVDIFLHRGLKVRA